MPPLRRQVDRVSPPAEGLLLRPAVTLAVEIYSPEREREFDEAEAELAAALARHPGARPQRTTRR